MLRRLTGWLILIALVGEFSVEKGNQLPKWTVNEITSIQQAINRIAETLQKIPQNIIPPGHIGVKRPISEEDLPIVVISVKNIIESSSGIGNFIGIQKEDTGRVSEIRGSKISGVFQIRIWDLSVDKVDEITTAIIETITADKTGLRKDGFLDLFLVGEIYSSKLSADPPKEAMVRLIEYKGMFEFVNRETFDPEEVIKEIHVHIDDVFDESVPEDLFDESIVIKRR